MGQEFFIKSANLESKIRQLLPSQGGLGAGQDLSGSTQIVPIIDLTETAEGSQVRADLQTSFSLTSITSYAVSNTTTTIANSTGYFRVFGMINCDTTLVGGNFVLTDGVTSKVVFQINTKGIAVNKFYDFNVFLEAGESLTCTAGAAAMTIDGCSRQIADINGDLVDP